MYRKCLLVFLSLFLLILSKFAGSLATPVSVAQPVQACVAGTAPPVDGLQCQR